MTLSQFLKVLYPYCNEGESKSEFVVHMVNQIMDGRPGRMREDGSYQNPLKDKDTRTLLNYSNGERSISSKDASTIYSSIKTEKFEKYISKHCSMDAQSRLLDDLTPITAVPKNEMTPQICSQLFETILRELASK